MHLKLVRREQRFEGLLTCLDGSGHNAHISHRFICCTLLALIYQLALGFF